MNRLQKLKQVFGKSVINDWFIRNMGLPDTDLLLAEHRVKLDLPKSEETPEETEVDMGDSVASSP